jgi:hypothetical protein
LNSNNTQVKVCLRVTKGQGSAALGYGCK